MSKERFLEHAESFDRAADTYERARPSYPADAVDWLLEGEPRTVLDLGAGTGKFTRLLAGRVDSIIAVEPSEQMLAQLRNAVPTADARLGSAEAIPVADLSVDAVIAAQAWHWVDADRAEPEVARVLKPGGMLGLIWNVRDDRTDWVRQMAAIIHDGGSSEIADNPPKLRPPFSPVEFFETTWVNELSRSGLVELVASRSHFIVQEPLEQRRILGELEGLLDTHPQTAGLDVLPVPYRTFAFRSRTA